MPLPLGFRCLRGAPVKISGKSPFGVPDGGFAGNSRKRAKRILVFGKRIAYNIIVSKHGGEEVPHGQKTYRRI